MTGLIYRAYLPSGISYIGQTTKSLERRKTKHWNNRAKKTDFHLALIVFGRNAFTWEVLEDNIPVELLNDREEYWISYYDSYHNGLNSTLTAQCYKDRIEASEKMSNSLKGKNKGKILSEQSKANMRKPKTEEHRKHISEGHKTYWAKRKRESL